MMKIPTMRTSEHYAMERPFFSPDFSFTNNYSLLGAWKKLQDVTSCSVNVGCEIEFYLDKKHSTFHAKILDKYVAHLRADGIEVFSLTREVGECQYEVSLPPSSDPLFAAHCVNRLKAIALRVSIAEGCWISFAARPDAANPPSALHINVSLVNDRGMNLYAKSLGTENETEMMNYSIAGLCEFMNPSMVFFAPTENSFKRFVNPITEGSGKFANAPSTVSWGGNNRTVAIRIPTSSNNPNSRHIEHRVPCADADPTLAIACILSGISFGIERRLPLAITKSWSNASDTPSNLALVKTRRQAVASWHSCKELQMRMNLSDVSDLCRASLTY